MKLSTYKHARRRRRSIVMASALVMVTLVGCAQLPGADEVVDESLGTRLCLENEPSPDQEAFRVIHNGGPTYEPYLLWGVKEGCFEKHGLSIESISTGTSSATQIAALVGGSADVATTNILDIMIADSTESVDIKILSAGVSYTEDALASAREPHTRGAKLPLASAFVVREGLGGQPIEAYKDMSVASPGPAGNLEIGFRQTFRLFGIPDESVDFITLPSSERLAALIRGDVDGALLTGSDLSKALEAGCEIGFFPGAFLYEPGPVTLWYALAPGNESDRARLEAFQKGLWESHELLNQPENRDRFIRFLIEDYGLTEEALGNLEIHTLMTRNITAADLLPYRDVLIEEGLIPASYRPTNRIILDG